MNVCGVSTDPYDSHFAHQVCEADERVRNFGPFLKTLEFVGDELERQVVLAGGCIRDMWVKDESLIKDYDVWVLGVKEEEIPDLDARLSNGMLHMMQSHNVHTIDPNVAAAISTAAACIDYPNRKFHMSKANLTLPWIPNKKIAQVIYTQCETMDDVLAQFDWHVCSFGFDGERVVTAGVTDFNTKTLTLNPDNALRSARSTLRRGFYLEEKFRGIGRHLKMPNETILALAAMLTLSGESKKS